MPRQPSRTASSTESSGDRYERPAGRADAGGEAARLCGPSSVLEAARALYRQGRAVLLDLGQRLHAGWTGIIVAGVELLGGDLALAEREVRVDIDFLAKARATIFLSTMTSLLSRLVRDQGRDDEALALSKTAEQQADEDDFDSQALWRSTRAPILARAGDLNGAEELARAAVDLVRRSEAPMLLADALVELAEVLKVAGRLEEASATMDEAIALYAAKGNVVSESQGMAWKANLTRA